MVMTQMKTGLKINNIIIGGNTMEKINELFLKATKEKFRFPYIGQI